MIGSDRDSGRGLPQGVVAVLRGGAPEGVETAIRGLRAVGVRAEVPITNEGAIELLELFADDGGPAVGVGTVATQDELRAAAEAGAAFAVSPHLDPDLVNLAGDLGLPYAPGVLTPSEARRALTAGATALKVFPVGSVGGAAHVRALMAVLPGVPVIASGGIAVADIDGYLDAGCVAVCLGSGLVDAQAARDGDVDQVAAHARTALTARRKQVLGA